MVSRDGVEAKAYRKSLKKTPWKEISFSCGVCGKLIQIYFRHGTLSLTSCWGKECCNNSLFTYLRDYVIKEGDPDLDQEVEEMVAWLS